MQTLNVAEPERGRLTRTKHRREACETAFLAIWRQLPGYRHLAWAVSRLGLIPLLNRGYARFADWRFRRQCSAGVCANR